MNSASLVQAAFAQVVITLVVLVVMGRARAQSMRAQRHRFEDVALGQNVWSEAATKAANNYKNQFELPVLFFAACGFALALRQADALMVALAWAFVAARAVHAAIHVTYNKVPHRATAFLVSALLVLAMWVVLVVRA